MNIFPIQMYEGVNFDLAIKRQKVNPRLSFKQTW